MTAPFDAVVVPDFSGKAAITFEARTLYLLASWIEFSGVCGRYPLHLACIGEPPASVRMLAERCGAIVTIHEPADAELGVYANKLRGLEVPAKTERILLLDADIIVLSSLAPLADEIPADAIAAAPSHSAIILPEMWEELYSALRIAPPAHRIPDFHRTLTMDAATDSSVIFPSFNSGVVLSPTRSRLRELWIEHLRVLGRFRPRWTETLRPMNMLVGDEPALATALHVLADEGAPVVQLRDRYNGRWRHLYRRSPKLSELALFHMTSSFSNGATLSEKLDGRSLWYQRKLWRRYGKRWLQHSSSYAHDAVHYLVPAAVELLQLGPILRKLRAKHIDPILGQSTGGRHAA